MHQIVCNVYVLNNIRTLDKNCLRVLPPTPPCYLNVMLIGVQSVYFPSDMRHYTQVFPGIEGQNLLQLET